MINCFICFRHKDDMKGLLRGLRYLAQIFEEKEPEIKIGYPTDVRHVGHIGWDGPSSKPSWMNDFQSGSILSNGNSNFMIGVNSRSVPPPLSDSSQGEKQKPRSRRQTNTLGSPLNSPSRKGSNGSKQFKSRPTNSGDSHLNSPPKNSRRRCSSNNSIDSPNRDSSTPQGRKVKTSGLGVESHSRDKSSNTRQSRPRKTKEPSRLKDKNSSSPIHPSSDCGPDGSESTPMRQKRAVPAF